MNKDAEGRWKVGMPNIKLKMRVKIDNPEEACGVPLANELAGLQQSLQVLAARINSLRDRVEL